MLTESPLIRAAQYVRMSSDQQDYSPEYQIAANAEYASHHGIEVVETYIDAGISGLGIEKREALKRLLADVLSGTANFTAILVYDVSRWGRFQNPDQAAHYEFICAEAGVRVLYCAETFENDGSPTTALMKHIKRAMAAEYSRELSVKVRRAKDGLRRKGFWPGAKPGYALRREIVSLDGRRLALRDAGEWKGFPNAHTRLAAGPEAEIAIVRRIFRSYLKKGSSYSEIARRLNSEGVPSEGGTEWSLMRIRGILTNPKYRGVMVVGKTRMTLGGPQVRTPPTDWVVVPGASPELVSSKLFDAVQNKIRERRRLTSDAEALDELRRIWHEYGSLSDRLVRAHGLYSPMTYQRRFGTMAQAFMRVGYVPTYAQFTSTQRLLSPPENFDSDLKDFRVRMVNALKILLEKHGRLTRRIIDQNPSVPSSTTYVKWFGDLEAVYAAVGYLPKGQQKTNMILNRCEGRGWQAKSERLARAPMSSNLQR